MLYQRIQTYFDVKKHRENYKGRGEPPPSDEEFKVLEDERKDYEGRFRKTFSKLNGWAKSILEDTSFSSLERHVHMEHLRPYYNLANIERARRG